jgi:hypothetical protein
MLFRPLDEVRIFGVRLPFTPGILPRQRRRLAVSIGAMVERELFTPAVVEARLKDPGVREGVKKSVALYTEELLSLPAAGFLDGAAAAGEAFLPFFREKSVNEILGLAEGDSSLEDALAGLLSRNAERIVSALVPWAQGAYPFAVKSFVKFIRRPEIHRELEDRGRVFLLKAILKLNVFQRFFISAAQYDKTLAGRMGEIIDDLAVQLEEALEADGVKQGILSGCERSLAAFLSDSVSSRAAARFLSGIIRPRLERPLGELLDLFAGLLRERFGQAELGSLLGMDGAGKDALDSFAAAKIVSFIQGRMAGILKTVDVKTMVSERVDSLEMEKVEGIILDVMARELKWIDIFGGILGFLIGIFQALFTHLLRSFG